jgi:hypothetical protein
MKIGVLVIFSILLVSFASAGLAPLYKLHSEAYTDNMYTADPENAGVAESLGYTKYDPEGYVFTTQVEGTVPLYRLHSGVFSDHLYTTDVSNKEYAESIGYDYQWKEGYIFSEPRSGAFPLHRLHWTNPDNPYDGDHYYTTNKNHKDWAIAAYGYSYQGIEGYMYVTKGDGKCTDTDGGKNAENAGVVYVEGELYDFKDHCVTKTGDNTYALSGGCTGSDCYVVDGYCDSSFKDTRVYSYERHQCDKCSAGACVEDGTGNDDTTSNDDTNNYGATSNDLVPEDIQVDDPEVVTCSDSDGGINSLKKGTVSFSDSTPSAVDSCLDSHSLKENYCAAGVSLGVSHIACHDGCSNGACIIPSACSGISGLSISKTNETCIDSNGNISIKVFNPDKDDSVDSVEFVLKNSLGVTLDKVVLDGPVGAEASKVFSLGVYPSATSVVVSPISGNETCAVSDSLGLLPSCEVFSNSEITDCNSLVSFFADPTSLKTGSISWELQNSNNLKYAGQAFNSATFSRNKGSGYNYIHSYIGNYGPSYVDTSLVRTALNNISRSGLCKQVSVGLGDGSSELVYLCKNLWSISKGIKVENTGEEDVFVIWFKGGRVFVLDSANKDYDPSRCNSYSECLAFESVKPRYSQAEIHETVSSLATSGVGYSGDISVDWYTLELAKYFLSACGSDVEATKDAIAVSQNWSCYFQPEICPKEGFRMEICNRFNTTINAIETRENKFDCTYDPSSSSVDGYMGCDSGCSVPEWFFSKADKGCVPFGYRFDVKVNDIDICVVDSEDCPDDAANKLKKIWLLSGDFDLSEGEFSLYCDADGEIKKQKGESEDEKDISCSNDYECFSGICVSDKCATPESLWAKFILWLKSLT